MVNSLDKKKMDTLCNNNVCDTNLVIHIVIIVTSNDESYFERIPTFTHIECKIGESSFAGLNYFFFFLNFFPLFRIFFGIQFTIEMELIFGLIYSNQNRECERESKKFTCTTVEPPIRCTYVGL